MITDRLQQDGKQGGVRDSGDSLRDLQQVMASLRQNTQSGTKTKGSRFRHSEKLLYSKVCFALLFPLYLTPPSLPSTLPFYFSPLFYFTSPLFTFLFFTLPFPFSFFFVPSSYFNPGPLMYRNIYHYQVCKCETYSCLLVRFSLTDSDSVHSEKMWFKIYQTFSFQQKVYWQMFSN